MHVYRVVRRRIREARYAGQPVRPIRWALDELAQEWEVLASVLGGRS
jgi:hypothetical protein